MKETRTLHLTTPYGNSYTIREEDGAISRDDMPGYFEKWNFIGIVPANGNSRKVISRAELFSQPIPDLLYKNGNPRWTVKDNDHGTFRTWGNTKYHGVKTLTVVLGSKVAS